MKPKRPVLRYHGGKWKLAPWILSFFPPHKIYVEPYGGAASILMQKERSYGEVYNDLDGNIVNVFRILQNPICASELKRLVELTPFSRDEFQKAYEVSDDPITRAHKMVIRAYMGFGSASMTRTHKTGFRSNSNRSGTTPAHDWVNWPTQIPAFIERLRGVVIENKNALEIMVQHDSELTLHYIDPPYPWSTRSSVQSGKQHYYQHEMTDENHEEMAECLHSLKGMIIVSGYPCDLYDNLLFPEWKRVERKHFADGARERTEVLWINRAAENALEISNHHLFSEVRA